MSSVEILRQAGRIVAGLIKEKTPPVFETCRKAYSDLGDLVAYSQKSFDDQIQPAFAAGIDSVISRLEVFRASHGNLAGVEKKMTDKEFSLYFKEQVEKAIGEKDEPGLRRLHALSSAINKASFFGTDGITLTIFVDPFQQATAQVDEDGKRITSGAAQKEEVTATPGIDIDDVKNFEPSDVLKDVAVKAEKASSEIKPFGWGWSLDLASKEFLHGERTVDFGVDGTKP
jgi:hypothetical protein